MFELIDFGEGRRLERFGDYLIDRPAIGTEHVARAAERRAAWSSANARFELENDAPTPQRGRWGPANALPERWPIQFGAIQFELKPTEFGHLGVFPEQAENWLLIEEWVRSYVRNGDVSGEPPNVLNLFAYTGGSSLAAAAAGARVTHVDSARGTVAWARRNAELSDLSAAPIRWIVEDARRFVERELTRGNRYDAVILDPPSYGHGPKGQAWKLERDLPALLRDAIALIAAGPSLVLLSCHTPSISAEIAAKLIREAAADIGRSGMITSGPLALEAAGISKRLPCGVAARFMP